MSDYGSDVEDDSEHTLANVGFHRRGLFSSVFRFPRRMRFSSALARGEGVVRPPGSRAKSLDRLTRRPSSPLDSPPWWTSTKSPPRSPTAGAQGVKDTFTNEQFPRERQTQVTCGPEDTSVGAAPPEVTVAKESFTKRKWVLKKTDERCLSPRKDAAESRV